MIDVVDLGGGSYRDLGRAHGEAFVEPIAALFGIRWRLLCQRSKIANTERLIAIANAHVEALKAFHTGLHDELLGMAETSGLMPWQLVVLNHYTDFRDIPPEEGGCSVITTPIDGHAAVAQTWDMHGSAEPFVRVLKLAPEDGPPLVTFTLTGCFGMTGLNAEGVAVCINNLTPNDARIGVVWPALVRRMLLETSAIAAVEVLESATLSSGHNYLVADKNQVFNVETTGRAYRVTHTDAATPYWHTNHYLSDELSPMQLPLHPATTTHDRYATLCRVFEDQAPTTFESLWELMGSHEGYPRSICSHGKGDDPSASKTCGGVICDVAGGRFLASAGCLHETPWTEIRP